jgi:probable F420-dependent oxidoreductase
MLPSCEQAGDRGMEIGATMFFTDYAIAAQEIGPALEHRGFESIWAPEHSHIPLSRRSPWPGGAELPKKYFDAMDPFVTLSVIAAVTRTLKLGTGVCLVIQRDTIQTAKLVASLDQVSQGRFLFGIGGGWNAEEMEDHGTEFKTRFKKLREQMEAMKAIWTQTKPEYQGDLVKFPPMMVWPKPVQKPYPPIILGGAFPHAARRAIAYGDGWIPIAGRGGDDLGAQIRQFHAMAKEAGRDPATLPITVFSAPEDLDTLKKYKDMGVARALVQLPSASTEEVMPILDRWAELMHRI